MYQQIKSMLELQDAMNTKVHSDWKNQGFAWYRAIWIECAELMDHYGWKWWKHQSPDLDQVTLELVDIWHFGLSLMLQEGASTESIAQKVVQAFESPKKSAEFREALEDFTSSTLTQHTFCVSEFATLMQCVDFSFDALYRQYLGKNVLNFFRQDHGYKEGSYKKVWDGKEDNEHLVEILNKIDIQKADAKDVLYLELERRYPKE